MSQDQWKTTNIVVTITSYQKVIFCFVSHCITILSFHEAPYSIFNATFFRAIDKKRKLTNVTVSHV